MCLQIHEGNLDPGHPKLMSSGHPSVNQSSKIIGSCTKFYERNKNEG